VQAIVLLKAPGKANWLAEIAEAGAEVEVAAGLRSFPNGERLAESPAGAPSRLLTSLSLPGLVPVPPAVAQAHLGVAGARGLAAPLRRWRPAAGRVRVSWEAGAGAVLTCDGPSGVSAQAVVELRGAGRTGAITPPPGGALVLRAWRTRTTWGAICGLVLAPLRHLAWGARHNASPPALVRRDGTRSCSRAWPPCTSPEPVTTGRWRLQQRLGRLHPRRWPSCSKPASAREAWAARFQAPRTRGPWQ
jgi:hypothetical protein